MKKIVLTGGGSSGHVTPNIALLPSLKRAEYSIHYIGSKTGIEKQLIESEGISYHAISTGKLRRYFDLKNVTDTFRVVEGLRQAFVLLGKIKPSIVFSKGGFVSCPVVWAAWLRRIPVVIHESDITPGLTNKLSIPFAKKVCYTFPESSSHLPLQKRIRTGMPIREGLLNGSRVEGKSICGFNSTKPVILVIGGSLGSETINRVIRNNLSRLLKDYNICHICGKGNMASDLDSQSGYAQFEYVNEEQPHILALADIVISRAGATVLFELLALNKPNLLIPLSKSASRGDQILNAASFENQGYSKVLNENFLDENTLMKEINDLYAARDKYTAVMREKKEDSGVTAVMNVLAKTLNNEI